MNIPNSAVPRIFEQNGWHFCGFSGNSLEEDEPSEVEIVFDWEIQSEPFTCVFHSITGAWWAPHSAQCILVRDISRLIYQGLREDLDRLVEAV